MGNRSFTVPAWWYVFNFHLELTFANMSQTSKAKPWFTQPKNMPDWLYRYFGMTIKPLITAKDSNDSRRLAQPPSFTENKPYAPATMWIHPPDAVFHLRSAQLDPTTLYRPHYPTQIQPSRGVIELHDSTRIPASLLTVPALSCAPIPEMQLLGNPTTHDNGLVAGPA